MAANTEAVEKLVGKGKGRAIVKVRPVHRLMALARATGRTVNEIADEFDYSISTVSKVLNSPLVKALVRKYAEKPPDVGPNEATRILKRFAPVMALGLLDIAQNSEDEGLRLKAIDSTLDRAGVSRVQRVDLEGAQQLDIVDATAIEKEIMRAKALPQLIAEKVAQENGND